MLRSEWLISEISRHQAVASMAQSQGWQEFLTDFLDPREEEAFKAFKMTPAENTAAIAEAQLAGKMAEQVRKWLETREHLLTERRNELMQIQNKQLEDYNTDAPPEKNKQGIIARLRQRWARA